MKSDIHARNYLLDLAGRGRYHFTLREAQAALGGSQAAAKVAIGRLAKQHLIASPARGFYLAVPPEYRALGCPPADQFIPALMQHLNLSYYVGLLSATQYHGAGHQRPQTFQVFLAKNRRPIRCGAVRVAFLARKRIADVPVDRINTPRGTLLVASVEATALDLIGYADQAGGLNQAATVLLELAERIDPAKLAAAADNAPVAWAQRLGYVLDHLGMSGKTKDLKSHVHRRAKESTALLPKARYRPSQRNKTWKLYVNVRVDAAL